MSDSGVFPFVRNRSLSDVDEDQADAKGDLVDYVAQTRHYDDRPVLIPHYRVLERRRSSASCSKCYLPSTLEYDSQNPSVDARQLETTQMRNNLEVFACGYSIDQGESSSGESASNSPVFSHPGMNTYYACITLMGCLKSIVVAGQLCKKICA